MDAAIQLLREGAQADRTLRKLKKQRAPAMVLAQDQMVKNRQIMVDLKCKMEEAWAEMRAEPFFPRSETLDQWWDWRDDYKVARDNYEHFGKKMFEHETEIKAAKDVCAGAARAQDEFLVHLNVLPPASYEERDQSDDSEDEDDDGTESDMSSLVEPDWEVVLEERVQAAPAHHAQPQQPHRAQPEITAPAAQRAQVDPIPQPAQPLPNPTEHEDDALLAVSFRDPDVHARFLTHRTLLLELEIAYEKHDTHRNSYHERLREYIEPRSNNLAFTHDDHANAFASIWRAECIELNVKINDAELKLEEFEREAWDKGLPIMTRWDHYTEEEHCAAIREEDEEILEMKRDGGLAGRVEAWMKNVPEHSPVTAIDGMAGSEVWLDTGVAEVNENGEEDTTKPTYPARSLKRKATTAADTNAIKKRTRGRPEGYEADIEDTVSDLTEVDTGPERTIKRKHIIPTSRRVSNNKTKHIAGSTPQDPIIIDDQDVRQNSPPTLKRARSTSFDDDDDEVPPPHKRARIGNLRDLATITVSGPVAPIRNLRDGDVVRNDDRSTYHVDPLRRVVVRRYCRRVRDGYL